MNNGKQLLFGGSTMTDKPCKSLSKNPQGTPKIFKWLLAFKLLIIFKAMSIINGCFLTFLKKFQEEFEKGKAENSFQGNFYSNI